MGRDKALLPWRGRSLLEAHTDLLQPETDLVIVVAGANADLLMPIVYSRAANLVVNPQPELGQFSSLRVGLQAVLNYGRDAAIIALVDRPPVSTDTLRALKAEFCNVMEREQWAVVPEIASDHGHPIIIAREMIEAFLRAPATSNAKHHVVGLCRSAQVIPVRFMDSQGRGTTSGSAEAVAYAVRAGATVINCSYTSTTRTQIEYDALAFARARGVLIVAAAGNAGADNDRLPVYPAAHPLDNVIAVASTNLTNIGLAPFPNCGRRTVGLAAPGSGINSTWLHGRYRSMSGTSMAAPAVTAAAAAIKARRGWKYNKLRARVLDSVSPDRNLRTRIITGGRLNFERAVGS